MNRTQRQHGARAGWHAAKIAAHQYTPTKRKPLAPIGDASINNASRVWTGDECCDMCGHYVCSCAPAAPAQALDVPAVPADPWAVGRKVKCTGDTRQAGVPERAYGLVGTVRSDRVAHFRNGQRGRCIMVAYEGEGLWESSPDDLEPLPDLPAADGLPAGWTPEACGWTQAVGVFHPGWVLGDRGRWRAGTPRVCIIDGRWGGITKHEQLTESAPTLAQACCAALNITLHEDPNGPWHAEATLPGGRVVIVGHEDERMDAEACARLALERFHAGGGR